MTLPIPVHLLGLFANGPFAPTPRSILIGHPDRLFLRPPGAGRDQGVGRGRYRTPDIAI